MRQISFASLPERHICVPKQSYIDFGDNFIFGELVYRRVGLSASCPVTPSLQQQQQQQHWFNGHFPGQPGSASTRIPPFWSCWSNDDRYGGDSHGCMTCSPWTDECWHRRNSSPPSNHRPTFYRPDALPVTQPTVLEHWREKTSYSTDLLIPSSPGGFPNQ